MRLLLSGLALALALAPAAGAQTVIQRRQPLDAARANVRDVLVSLGDSLSTIEAAGGRLQRDLRQSSTAWLRARGRDLAQSCARSTAALGPARDTVAAGQWDSEKRRKQQAEMMAALGRLEAHLARCEADFTARSTQERAEELRGNGNAIVAELVTKLRTYQEAAQAFFATFEIEVTPVGIRNAPRR